MPSRLALVLGLVAVTAHAQDAGVPLIPRAVLFGNPERLLPTLSPDGASLAWVAPDEKNVLQVWVRPLNGKDTVGTVVTASPKRAIRNYRWGEDSKSILYLQDTDGDENDHVLRVDLISKNVRDLTPWQGVRAVILASSFKQPNVLLVAANVRDRKYLDVWRIALDSGAATLDTENPGDVSDWFADGTLLVRAAMAHGADGGSEIRFRDGPKTPWRALITTGIEEDLEVVDFTEDGHGLIIKSSVSADTNRLLEKNLKSGAERVLLAGEQSDVGGVLRYPQRRGVRAARLDVGGRFEWRPTEPSYKGELDALRATFTGDFEVASMDGADTKWIVNETRDVGSIRSFLWDRKTKKAQLLFSWQPALDSMVLAPMKPLTITARDGLKLPSYLTLPVGKAPKGLPMVLLVHGGPWGRDFWGYNATVQWLANRGYAVLQINFRASTGYGKTFLNAGNHQWAMAMEDDLFDGVAWAVKEGIADPKKVAIMGRSYGGYATLVGLTSSPDTFACGVDVVGPTNLFTLLSSMPAHWAAFRKQLLGRIGDPDNPADQENLKRISPLFSAAKIKVPLLIAQGGNDVRVKPAEAEQIVKALEQNGLPVTYLLYPDEGHEMARPDNRVDFNARAEAFLVPCLGGRAEPMPADGKTPGSSVVVKVVPARGK